MQQIEHTGIVQHIEGNKAQILIVQQSACSACHAKSACTMSDQQEKVVEVLVDDHSIREGDEVIVYGSSSIGLQAVLIAFVLPLLLVFLLLFILSFFMKNEAVAGLIALSVLIPYYLILSLFNKKLKSKFEFHIKKEISL
ncbi:SoxR reducing system RseC family protein [Porphyromonadaceae sp. NP-X]|jgi:sigma-E factor negative regulatory protein RseC|nr:SoxR reducing system RseC family protein [Porphyromonadaceae sp. NP-X]NLJ21196.1 SoxR reducing system RseC family protein [Bacteroidales bacterium]HNZ61525.1 SoxR reducing system RseC family protein [Paludibacteraceae bacterium]